MLLFAKKKHLITTLPSACAFELTCAVIEEAGTLKLAIAYLLSQNIASHLHAGATAIVHEPGIILAQTLKDQCQSNALNLVFATTVEGNHNPDWVDLILA
jgi:hypothetical protein